MARHAATAARAESLLGQPVVSTSPVAGGSICTTTRLRLTSGRSVVLKTRPHPPAGFFAAEAHGLRWLREAGGAPVPEVLAVTDDCLVLDWVEPARPSVEAAEAFGRALATTHRAGADVFGAERDGYVGLAPLPNRPLGTWPEFYAARRVQPYLRLAVDRAAVTPEEAADVQAVLDRIDELSGPAEPPARLHGDLWAGNVVWTADSAWLIDPAAHGGHRETDLAMLALFGVPNLPHVLAAYDEAFPLADGWQRRVGLHQLHPLLVHAVLFGGSYGARAATAARSLLGR
ncbi:fructosamine kinase family protein [Aeromicrobium sp. IC_218]|uniref:fructosamine kinase family protein n=1 Tax=Aeromicrobium sp. IC_218 TaxID=2545468 RepID=UPI0010392B1E|nr:fructosamine kinase family protein [Aeromicrobium sp. IC_218]TCI99385.1 fructosamine kinase [Aeromicrobium sp. IC_218]